MANINFITFQGLRPIIEPRLLGETQAVKAENLHLDGGVLRAIKGTSEIETLADNDRLSIFLYGSTWLSWTTDVDVVRGPIFQDNYDRIYYTGDGVPKVLGADEGVQVEYDLGVPAPTTAPTVESIAKGEIDWTPEWQYQYENPQTGIVTAGPTPISPAETTPGKEYTVAIPTGVGEGEDDVFILYFDGSEDDNGSELGRLYPDISFYVSNNDFFLQGAEGRGTQTNVGSTATYVIDYDTSRASDYKVERVYKYAFVSGWGEVGNLSDESIIISVDPTQDATISDIEITVPGNRNITHVNIYRTSTTDAGEFFFFVKQIEVGEATTLDDINVIDLGAEAPAVDYNIPPTDMVGLVALPGEFFAGFFGKTVFFSEPGQPHAWPEEYGLTVEYDIVGLGVNSSGLVVLTKGTPELMIGEQPSRMTQTKLDTRQACSSKRSISSLPSEDAGQTAVIYASPDGLVMVQGGIPIMVTKNHYSKEQWSALSPSSIMGDVHDGKYYGFTAGDNIIFDLDAGNNTLTTTDETATGLYVHLEDDTLYLIQSDKIVSWNTSNDNLTLAWRSRDIISTRPVAPSVARVRAASVGEDEVTLLIYVDGSEVVSTNVRTQKAFRLPTIRVGTKWAIEISSKVDTYEVLVSNSMQDLA